VSRSPCPDVLTPAEIGALGNLPPTPPPTQVAVNRKPLAAQLACFTPPPAGRVVLGRLMVPTPQNRDLDRLSEVLAIALDYLLHLAGEFVARNEDGDLRPDACQRDVASG
jgi:hypothetical protein